MPVTLSDIARTLDISVVTVSKVLRNQGRIGKVTRERVLRCAQELNYHPNWVARSLATRKTFTIGLILPELTHSFFADVARLVAATARRAGYHVVISCFEEDPQLEVSEVDSMLARQVDGIILATSQPHGRLDVFKKIQQRKVPCVLIDRPVAGADACFVGADNRAIGRMATQHLFKKGCTKIAHLRGPEFDIAEDRLAGYRRALAMSGLKSDERYVADGGHHNETGYEAMKRLLTLSHAPDGVFCFNDPVAVGAMKAIMEAGLNVPNDIAVVGAGNIRYSDLLAVPLTTIDQGTGRIGLLCCELLIARIDSKYALRAQEILLTPKLIERESTRRKSVQGK